MADFAHYSFIPSDWGGGKWGGQSLQWGGGKFPHAPLDAATVNI